MAMVGQVGRSSKFVLNLVNFSHVYLVFFVFCIPILLYVTSSCVKLLHVL